MENTAEEVKIKFDLDQFNAGDFDFGWWEDIQNGKFSAIREMIENYAVVEGLQPGETLTSYLRSLKLNDVVELSNQLMAIVNEKQNPSKNGKNLNGASRSTSSAVRARRR